MLLSRAIDMAQYVPKGEEKNSALVSIVKALAYSGLSHQALEWACGIEDHVQYIQALEGVYTFFHPNDRNLLIRMLRLAVQDIVDPLQRAFALARQYRRSRVKCDHDAFWEYVNSFELEHNEAAIYGWITLDPDENAEMLRSLARSLLVPYYSACAFAQIALRTRKMSDVLGANGMFHAIESPVEREITLFHLARACTASKNEPFARSLLEDIDHPLFRFQVLHDFVRQVDVNDADHRELAQIIHSGRTLTVSESTELELRLIRLYVEIGYLERAKRRLHTVVDQTARFQGYLYLITEGLSRNGRVGDYINVARDIITHMSYQSDRDRANVVRAFADLHMVLTPPPAVLE